MRFLLALFGFFFLIVTGLMAVIVWKVRKNMKAFRDSVESQMQDENFQRMADKNYYRKKQDQGPVFDEEYFKGDPMGKKRKARHQQQQQQQQTRRTTRTADGVTIIDDREPGQRDKKIFAQDEGEYVDFIEEDN